MSTSSLRDSEGSRHDANWSDQRKEDTHEKFRDENDQPVDFHWSGGSDQPRELLAATMVTGSTVESIDSKGLSITAQAVGDGDKLSVLVVSPEVMKGGTVGEDVSLELDGRRGL